MSNWSMDDPSNVKIPTGLYPPFWRQAVTALKKFPITISAESYNIDLCTKNIIQTGQKLFLIYLILVVYNYNSKIISFMTFGQSRSLPKWWILSRKVNAAKRTNFQVQKPTSFLTKTFQAHGWCQRSCFAKDVESQGTFWAALSAKVTPTSRHFS